MQLIHRQDRARQRISFSQIEAPFVAVFKVQKALHQDPYTHIEGLDVHSYDRAWSQDEILQAVERGDLLLVSDDPFSPLSNDTFGKYSHITGKDWIASDFHIAPAQEKPPLPDAYARVKPSPQEPGFYSVPKSTTAEQLKKELFPLQNPAVMRKFHALNPNLSDVKAGAMIVLSDPSNLQCTREEALLMEAAATTHKAFEPLSPQEANFLARHRNEIETFLAQGSTAIGIAEVMFAKHLEAVKTVLGDIEALHQKTFLRDGNLRSPAFFAERKRLLTALDTHLTTLTRKGIAFPDHPNLKSALGISNRSLVHRWTKAGAAGQIPGYATHIDGVARAAKVIKYGGWVGTAIGGGASYMKVQKVCSAGSTQTCEKIRLTEAGSFSGGIIGGAITGFALSGSTAGALCLALGMPTAGAGTLACAVVVVGAGALAGGAVGGHTGELFGEVIYEKTK